MAHPSDPNRPNPHEDALDIPADATVDLSFDDGSTLDLQKFADEAAEQVGSDLGSEDDVNGLINKELERTLEEARTRIQDLEKREQEYMDKHHRLLADFSNYRNRTTREIQMAVDLEVKKLLTEILPVMDNFERSLESTYPSLETFQGGVALIQKQFQDVLRKIGVTPVELKVGDPFDAQHAEALTTMANPALPDGSVAAVYEKGYNLNGALLRPARVVVNSVEDGAQGSASAQ